MKLVLAPFLANFAFSVPFAPPPPAIPEIVNQVQTEAPSGSGCGDVWERVCSGTNSNGNPIIGDWTCGERVQYVFDRKLGRTPTMAAAIARVLSECPTKCVELADNQCDDYVEDNLQIISESDCSATWDATCSGVNSAGEAIYGSFTCGQRVKYDNRRFQNLLRSLQSVNNQCREQCEHITERSYNQCVDFFERKMNEIPEPAPLGTCQEAFDRTCNEGWGSYTCGARVKYVFDHPLRSNYYHHPIGEPATITNAIAEVYRQCPNDCKEFQSGNCDDEVEQNFEDDQIENNDDYEEIVEEEVVEESSGSN